MSKGITILLQRINKLYQEDDVTPVKVQVKDPNGVYVTMDITDFIPEYGEPLYVESNNYLFIGDGVIKYDTTDPTKKIVVGTTIGQFLENHDYYNKVINGSLYGDYTYENEIDVTKEGVDGTSRIANTKYVKDVIKTLDSTSNGDKSKTATQIKEEDGIVTATFTPIEITASQVSDLEDVLGNLVSDLKVAKINVSPSQTLKSIAETDGKIEVELQNIEITYDQIKDGTTYKRPLPGTATPKMDSGSGAVGTSTSYSREDHVHPADTNKAAANHTHGNLSNSGAIGTTSGVSVVTTTNGALTTANLATSDPSASGTSNSFISSISQSGTGKITASKASLPNYATSNTQGGGASSLNVSAATSGTIYVCGVADSGNAKAVSINKTGTNNPNAGVRIDCALGVLKGAAWNDFAENRKCNAKAGTVVCETGKGDLIQSSERLQAGAYIVSDTYGMLIGQEGDGFSPVAVAGRVLSYYGGDVSEYKAGDAVCAGQFGRVWKMTREEIKEYPDRILGFVSEIPEYDTWNNVKVNNRI